MLRAENLGIKPAIFAYSNTELRIQENTSLHIAFVNGNLMGNSREIKSGISARVYKNGVWGFASHPELSKEAATSSIKSATDNALYLDSREKRGKSPLPHVKGTIEKEFYTKKKRLNQMELVTFVKEVDTYIQKNLKNLTSRTVSLRTIDMEKSLITSTGTTAYTMIPRSNVIVSLSTDKDGAPVELFEVFGGFGQYEDIFGSPDELFPKIDVLYEHLMKLPFTLM